MYVYLFCTIISVFLILALSALRGQKLECYRSKKLNYDLLIACIPILGVTIFRWNMAPDTTYLTGSYYGYYQSALMGNPIIKESERLFWEIFYLFPKLELSWFWTLSVLGGIYVICAVWFIRKNSNSYAISLFLYMALGLLTLPFGALRQALAQSFILYAYHLILREDYDNKKDGKKWLVALILAGFCHNSSFALIPVFILAQLNIKIKVYVITAIIGAVLTPFIGPIIKIILQYTRFNIRYLNSENTFSIAYVLLGAFIVLTSLFFLTESEKQERKNNTLINIMLIYEVFMCWSGYLVDAYRIIHMFSPAMVVLIPNVIKRHRRENKIFLSIAYFIVCGLLFWQNNKNVEYQSVFSNLLDAF